MGLRAGAAVLAIALAVCGCTSAPAPRPSAKPLSAGCSTAVTTGTALRAIRPVTATVPGKPTAVVAADGGRWVFASVSSELGGEVAVFAASPTSLRLVRTVPVPGASYAYGLTMTHDGRFLLVADYKATMVLRVSALERGHGDLVLGELADTGSGQFEVTVSADDQYVYVADETSGALSVFDLARALRDGFAAPGVAVGTVPLAYGAVGIAVSPDGALLYVTTLGGYGPAGRLWVISSARADHGAGAGAVLGQVSAGCQPVRVEISPDGATAWVTALQSNALLAFSAKDLLSDPRHALRAVVPVGAEPVGLALADNGRVALVGNSDRGLVPGSGGVTGSQTVSVINTAAALAGRPAGIGAIPAGSFPRDLSIGPGTGGPSSGGPSSGGPDTGAPGTGEVYLGNFNSGTIEEFPVPPVTAPHRPA